MTPVGQFEMEFSILPQKIHFCRACESVSDAHFAKIINSVISTSIDHYIHQKRLKKKKKDVSTEITHIPGIKKKNFVIRLELHNKQKGESGGIGNQTHLE